MKSSSGWIIRTYALILDNYKSLLFQDNLPLETALSRANARCFCWYEYRTVQRAERNWCRHFFNGSSYWFRNTTSQPAYLESQTPQVRTSLHHGSYRVDWSWDGFPLAGRCFPRQSATTTDGMSLKMPRPHQSDMMDSYGLEDAANYRETMAGPWAAIIQGAPPGNIPHEL